MYFDTNNRFVDSLNKGVLILDGAMGTMVQSYNLSDTEFRGLRFKNHSCSLYSNNDILSLSQPEIVIDIHKRFLFAGADIIETNTFNSNQISQKEYHLQHLCYELNYKAALNAKKAIKEYQAESNYNRDKFVAGSIGPSNISLYLAKEYDFNLFRDAYISQIEGLLDGGVDLLIVETVYDTLSAKAILAAIQDVFIRKQINIPIVVSSTIDSKGRNLIGQSLEAFYHTISSFEHVISIGLNCSFGIDSMLSFICELSEYSNLYVTIYANAGLPNQEGIYTDSPEYMSNYIRDNLSDRKLNIIGGCCGTTPLHIEALVKNKKILKPKLLNNFQNNIIAVGLESISSDDKPVYISEKANISGSKQFKDLVLSKKFTQAIELVYSHIDSGCQMIDLNLDDSIIDNDNIVFEFIECLKNDIVLSKVPVVIDSSNWGLIEKLLRILPGKSIVNSLSLGEGIEEFIRRATIIKRYGASVIVLAADETGLSLTYSKKIEVFRKAFNILVDVVSLSQDNIIFDPLIMPIGTGIAEHNFYVTDVIDAIKWINTNLPKCSTIIGLSNVSFAYRGNNYFRKYLNSIVLKSAKTAGLDYVILNPLEVIPYDKIPKIISKKIEFALFNNVDNPTDILLKSAEELSENSEHKQVADRADVKIQNVSLIDAILKINSKYIQNFIAANLDQNISAIDIIEKYFIPAMSEIGDKFNNGYIYLPQVVKSASSLKLAFEILKDNFDFDSKNLKNKTVLLATVRGDVHDIGKNIIASVLACNNYRVIDLGVKVLNETIIQSAFENKVDYIAVSGLISPSLNEMIKLATMMESNALKIPLIVGGAATSKLHTATKISPNYSHSVIHIKNPPDLIKMLSDLETDPNKEKQINNEYSNIISAQENRTKYNKQYLSLREAQENRFINIHIPTPPKHEGVTTIIDYDIFEIADYIDWDRFFAIWKIKKGANINTEKNRQSLKSDALAMIEKIKNKNILHANAKIGIFKATPTKNSMKIIASNKAYELYMFRTQTYKENSKNLSICDFLSLNDYIVLFAATIGIGLNNYIEYLEIKKKDVYQSLLLKIIADCLVEAFVDILNNYTIKELWCDLLAFEHSNSIRPAFGFPMLPDHSQKQLVFEMLDADEIGVSLTENYAMQPSSSICGMIINNPDAKYFNIDYIAEDQVLDYAKVSGIDVEIIKNNLSEIIR